MEGCSTQCRYPSHGKLHVAFYSYTLSATHFSSCLMFKVATTLTLQTYSSERFIKLLTLCYQEKMLLFTMYNGPISQTLFMLSIAINRAAHVCATVIIKQKLLTIVQP